MNKQEKHQRVGGASIFPQAMITPHKGVHTDSLARAKLRLNSQGSLGENALTQVLETLETGDRDKAGAVVVADNAIDDLHTAIKDCLYCGLQFSDTTDFCLNCGRPTERAFKIRPIQESKFDRLRREMKEKDDMIRQQRFYYDCSGPLAHKDCLYCGLQFSDTTDFCPNCGRPTERALRRLDPS